MGRGVAALALLAALASCDRDDSDPAATSDSSQMPAASCSDAIACVENECPTKAAMWLGCVQAAAGSDSACDDAALIDEYAACVEGCWSRECDCAEGCIPGCGIFSLLMRASAECIAGDATICASYSAECEDAIAP